VYPHGMVTVDTTDVTDVRYRSDGNIVIVVTGN